MMPADHDFTQGWCKISSWVL